MENKKFFTNLVTVKTEKNGSPNTKGLLPTSFSQLATKNVSTTRLASFKPPRDLLLTGSSNYTNSSFSISNSTKNSKRTFMPNINVTRKKGSSETVQNEPSGNVNQKFVEKDGNKKVSSFKKKNINVVQTKGVFSEGLAPGKVKAFNSSTSEKSYNEKQILDKPKLNLNKKIIKNDEDNKLKAILKDDFIDNPSLVPDISFIPNCLPMMYNVKKFENVNVEKTFEKLQLKKEKISKLNEMRNEKQNEAVSVFDNKKSPKLFLFEFPSFFEQKDDLSERKKTLKVQQNDNEKQNIKSGGLASLGEGFLGYLRIHENGKAYLVAGNTIVPLCIRRHNTRQEVMSTGVDVENCKGEIISLGTVDASFTCSGNFFQDII